MSKGVGAASEVASRASAEGERVAPGLARESVRVQGVHRLLLLLALVLAGVPMLVAPGGRDVSHGMEVITLLTAQEMRHAVQAGTPDALLVTRWRGEPRIRKPPLMAWLNLLAWRDLDADAGADALAARARIVAGLLGLMTVWATWSIGRTLDGPELGVVAAMIAGTTFMLSRQARLATFDIGLVAFATLGVACAGRAIGARGGRWWLGWGACALATAAALYAKNALALVLVGLPGALIAWSCGARGDRRRDLVGLGGALLVAAAAGAAWYAAVLARFPEQAEVLRHETLQPRGGDAQAPWYYLGLIPLVAPWTIWLVAGLVHPFNPELRAARAERGLRGVRLVPWLWLVAVVVLLSIPAAKQQRYVVPVVPAAALLAAAVFVDHGRLARLGRPDRAVRPVAALHWATMALGSVPLTVLVVRPALFGANAAKDIGALPAWIGAALAAALLALAIAGWRRHRAWDARGAVLAGATWSALAWTATWIAYGAAPEARAPARETALRLRADHPGTRFALIGAFRGAEGGDTFRFYLDAPLPSVAPADAEATGGDAGLVVLCESGRAGAEAALSRAGRRPAEFFELGGARYAVWTAD